MFDSSTRLCIFAKAPTPGKVKTRIAKHLGNELAVNLHSHLTKHCLESTKQYNFGPMELWCSPSCEHAFFIDCQKHFNIQLRPQLGNNLGERMFAAFTQGLSESKSVILIGTDCPQIDNQYLNLAQQYLQTNDVVLGPAQDGGYVLIGLRRCDIRIFNHVVWGSDQVLQQTRENLLELGWQWQELPVLRDVDRPDDLDYARQYLGDFGAAKSSTQLDVDLKY